MTLDDKALWMVDSAVLLLPAWDGSTWDLWRRGHDWGRAGSAAMPTEVADVARRALTGLIADLEAQPPELYDANDVEAARKALKCLGSDGQNLGHSAI